MDIINGLPEFFTEDEEFMQKAREYGVQIHDIRKPPPRKDLHIFSGIASSKSKLQLLLCLVQIAPLAKGPPRFSSYEALRRRGLKTAFVATGQTGLLQGAKYGVAVDVLSSGFQTGEVENEIVKADETEHPDISRCRRARRTEPSGIHLFNRDHQRSEAEERSSSSTHQREKTDVTFPAFPCPLWRVKSS